MLQQQLGGRVMLSPLYEVSGSRCPIVKLGIAKTRTTRADAERNQRPPTLTSLPRDGYFFTTLTDTPSFSPSAIPHFFFASRTRFAIVFFLESAQFAPVSCMRPGDIHVANRLIAATSDQPWLMLDANARKTAKELQLCARN